MDNLISKINNFFNNTLEKIYIKHKNNKSRDRIIKIKDIIKYTMLYAYKKNTKETSARKTIKNTHYTTFDKKINNIPISFFDNLLDETKELFKQILEDNQINKLNQIINNRSLDIFNESLEKYNIFSVDGSCRNVVKDKQLHTNLDLHIFNNNTKIPYNIINSTSNIKNFVNNKNNVSNKNNEIKLFYKYLKSNNNNNNIIYLFDRAYASYTFIKYLIDNNIKFIIRIRDNFDILKEHNTKITQNSNIIKYIKDTVNIKIINNKINTKQTFILRTNEKKLINVTKEYNLITNLADAKDFNNNLIINLYSKRWEIETYIGTLKRLFKYDVYRLKSDEEINKFIIIDQFIFIINQIFILISLKTKYDDNIIKLNSFVKNKINKNVDMRYNINKQKCKESYHANVYINFSNFLDLFYDETINIMINGNINIDICLLLNKSLKIRKDKKNRKNDRVALIPFSKWYVKMYHKIYQDKKILKAIINNTLDNLDKNLKVKAKKIMKQINLDCI